MPSRKDLDRVLVVNPGLNVVVPDKKGNRTA